MYTDIYAIAFVAKITRDPLPSPYSRSWAHAHKLNSTELLLCSRGCGKAVSKRSPWAQSSALMEHRCGSRALVSDLALVSSAKGLWIACRQRHQRTHRNRLIVLLVVAGMDRCSHAHARKQRSSYAVRLRPYFQEQDPLAYFIDFY